MKYASLGPLVSWFMAPFTPSLLNEMHILSTDCHKNVIYRLKTETYLFAVL